MRRSAATGGLSAADGLARIWTPEFNTPGQSRGDQSPKRWPMNAAGNQAEILVYQEIGFWYGSAMFIEQLNQLGNVDTIDVRINSIGGIASEAIAMYQALVRHPALVRVWIDAAAYSAASVLAMAASPGELRMAFNARFMMHNAWNIVAGDKADMRKEGDVLEMLDGTLALTYGKRMTALSKDEILTLLDAETWYDAEGAVAAGAVDDVFDPGDEQLPDDAANMHKRLEHAAGLGLRFKNMPKDLFDRGAKVTAATPPAVDLSAGVEVDARWAAVRNREAA